MEKSLLTVEFHKGEHKRCFAYEAYTVCDKHNFVLDVVVTSGNVYDSAALFNHKNITTSKTPLLCCCLTGILSMK